MWNLGNQAVGVTAIEDTRDLGALTVRIGDVFQVRGVFEFPSDVGVGESADHVLPVKQSSEDLSFIAGDGIERFYGSLWSDVLAGCQAIQSADCVRGIIDLGQGC